MHKRVFALDFDGPLAWTGGYELFLKFVESRGITVDWDEWHRTHYIDGCLPSLPKDTIREEVNRLSQLYHYSPYGEYMLWIPKAHEVLKKYESVLEYVIITARQDYAAILAQKFLDYQFSDIPFKHVYFDHAYKKADAIIHSGAEIIVEDNVKEALRIVDDAPDVRVILLPTFLPSPHALDHPRVFTTRAYHEAERAQDDSAKIAALQAAWFEVDAYIESWLKTVR